MKKLIYTTLTVLFFNTTFYGQVISPVLYHSNMSGHVMSTLHDSLIYYDWTSLNLYKSDGVNPPILVKSMPAGYLWFGSYVTSDSLFCYTITNNTTPELWKSNGTTAGTTMLATYPKLLIKVMDTIFFSKSNDSIYKLNDNGTISRGIFYFGSSAVSYQISGVYTYDHYLMLDLYNNSFGLYGCVRYDVNTRLSQTIFWNVALGNDPAKYACHDTIYTGRYGLQYFAEINPTGTMSVVDSNYQVQKFYGVLNNKLLFHGTCTSSPVGSELYAFDLNTRTISLLKDINPGVTGSLDATNGYAGFQTGTTKAYFYANDGTGDELWVTDATTAGTHMVANLSAIAGQNTIPWGAVTKMETSNTHKTTGSIMLGDTLHTCLSYVISGTGYQKYIVTDGNTLWQINIGSAYGQEALYWLHLNNEVYFTDINSASQIYKFSDPGITTSVLTYGIDGIKKDMALYPNPTTGNVSVNLIKEYKNIKK